jgi:DNA-binding beta-propeller fold protein YncE
MGLLFSMNSCKIIFSFLALCVVLIQCRGQSSFGDNYLKFEKAIRLPAVTGRIDHMDVNLQEKVLYVAALGNNSVEIIDLENGKLIHSIHGMDEPQGIGYIPQTNEIFIANGGTGDCYFFNAKTFEKTASIHLSSDADDVRYDSIDHKIYVGYGEGGIGVIDALSHKQTGNVKLPAHPEGFQLDKKLNRILVNVPDKNIIAVIDLSQLKIIDTWKRNTPSSNFPMALDAMHHILYVGYRHPPNLFVFDISSGKEMGSVKMVSDADDVYFDPGSSRIYVSGGGGSIDIFQTEGQNNIRQLANIVTSDGARTSLLVPPLHLFILAERAQGGHPASVMVYQTMK